MVFEKVKIMLSFVDNIKKYHIYNNEQLREFIINLEEKYAIKNETEFFKDLVNFSQNNAIPYHGWFKYREGYSHTLVKELIDREGLSVNEFIIDPFCGSGTTLVESSLNGFSSLGMDINPMSSFISNAKANVYTNEDINIVKEYIGHLETEKPNKVDLTEYDDIKRYFNNVHLNDLLFLKKFIDSINSEKVKKLFLTGYLSIIEECSDRKRDGNGLKTSKSKVDNVMSFYLEKMSTIYNDLIDSRISINARGSAVSASSVDLLINVNDFIHKTNKSPGAIIFSPPYANSFDYFESYKMELRLGGFTSSSKDLKEFRNLAVRSFVNTSESPIAEDLYINLMAEEIENSIPSKEALTGKRDNRTRKVPKMIRGYFNDMKNILKQCSLSLPTGKKSYIVVDQSSYLGKIIPTDLLLSYLGEQNGFKVNQIIICRKAKTSGQQTQRFPYLAESLRESIVVLEKI